MRRSRPGIGGPNVYLVTFETWPDEKYQDTYPEHAHNIRSEYGNHS